MWKTLLGLAVPLGIAGIDFIISSGLAEEAWNWFSSDEGQQATPPQDPRLAAFANYVHSHAETNRAAIAEVIKANLPPAGADAPIWVVSAHNWANGARINPGDQLRNMIAIRQWSVAEGNQPLITMTEAVLADAGRAMMATGQPAPNIPGINLPGLGNVPVPGGGGGSTQPGAEDQYQVPGGPDASTGSGDPMPGGSAGAGAQGAEGYQRLKRRLLLIRRALPFLTSPVFIGFIEALAEAIAMVSRGDGATLQAIMDDIDDGV